MAFWLNISFVFHHLANGTCGEKNLSLTQVVAVVYMGLEECSGKYWFWG